MKEAVFFLHYVLIFFTDESFFVNIHTYVSVQQLRTKLIVPPLRAAPPLTGRQTAQSGTPVRRALGRGVAFTERNCNYHSAHHHHLYQFLWFQCRINASPILLHSSLSIARLFHATEAKLLTSSFHLVFFLLSALPLPIAHNFWNKISTGLSGIWTRDLLHPKQESYP